MEDVSSEGINPPSSMHETSSGLDSPEEEEESIGSGAAGAEPGRQASVFGVVKELSPRIDRTDVLDEDLRLKLSGGGTIWESKRS